MNTAASEAQQRFLSIPTQNHVRKDCIHVEALRWDWAAECNKKLLIDAEASLVVALSISQFSQSSFVPSYCNELNVE